MGYTIEQDFIRKFSGPNTRHLNTDGIGARITADTLEDFGPALDEVSDMWKPAPWNYAYGKDRAMRPLRGGSGFDPWREKGKWVLVVKKGSVA